MINTRCCHAVLCNALTLYTGYVGDAVQSTSLAVKRAKVSFTFVVVTAVTVAAVTDATVTAVRYQLLRPHHNVRNRCDSDVLVYTCTL
jgi:hypothetical protein